MKDDGTAFVTEGEKDADRVASLGHCTTTAAAGKWTADCVTALAGRDVIVLEDNDRAGRAKALAAAKALHGTAKTIRVVSLPGLGEREDVSDWLYVSRYNDINKLVEICFDTPLWQPTSSASAPSPAPPNVEETTGNDNGEPKTATPTPAKKPTKSPWLPFIDMSRWDEEDPPPREWAVPDRGYHCGKSPVFG